jgi:hypothetical protein
MELKTRVPNLLSIISMRNAAIAARCAKVPETIPNLGGVFKEKGGRGFPYRKTSHESFADFTFECVSEGLNWASF